MAIDPASPRSRRALLAAALGAGVATIASALGRPSPARAADGFPVICGDGNFAGTSTSVICSSDQDAFVGIGLNGYGVKGTSWKVGVYGLGNGAGIGVAGSSTDNDGVHGSSSNGVGVGGVSASGNGMYGTSFSGVGLYGESNSTAKPATLGLAYGGTTGVFGYGGPKLVALPAMLPNTGVYGIGSGHGVCGATTTGIGVKGEGGSGGIGVAGVSGTNSGVRGDSPSGHGVHGESTSSDGVHGESTSGNGVLGGSASGSGVLGTNTSATKPAIIGTAGGNSTGVQGFSGPGAAPAAPAKTGLFGYAVQDTAARGVVGRTTVGQGVLGEATTGYGVVARTGSGVAAYAATSGPKVGTALQAIGKVKFDKSVGIATIAAGTSSVTVTPGIDLTATSAVVATLQGSAGGTTGVYRVSVNATTDQFTIYLSAKATVAAKVAWHVFG